MEARRVELQGMKKSAQRRAAAAVGIDEDEWDGTVESILGAEFRAGGAQAYVTRGAYGVEGRDPDDELKAVALVIGIQNYEGTRELKNTLSDAKAVAEKFEGMGFDVMSLTDENAEGGKVDQDQMEDAIEAFIEKVDENTIAAFAYMGASANGPRSLLPRSPAWISLRLYACAPKSVCDHLNRLLSPPRRARRGADRPHRHEEALPDSAGVPRKETPGQESGGSARGPAEAQIKEPAGHARHPRLLP
jgi:hypothetical protein